MTTPRRIARLLPVLLLTAGPALAADVGVPGKKLTITEKSSGASSVALTLVHDDGIQKGAGVARGEPPGLEGRLDVFFTDAPSSVRGAFTMAPEFWRANSEKSARYVQKDAGSGPGEVFSATVKNGKRASVLTRGRTDADGMFDLSVGLPSESGGITTVLTIFNTADGSLHRMCTKWAVAAGSKLVPKTKKKATALTATRGVPTECPPLVSSPPECEMLNAVECLLPYPSSRFLVPAATPTGYAVRFPEGGFPPVNGPPIPPSQFDGLDGFSPGSQILMHFPQGVDVVASDASRLLEPECCGQPPGPPWIDTRTYTGRSLEPDSPTVLLDADTGERVLHFVENDGRPHDPARELFFLRPAVILTPGHRYVVAVRNLIAPSGETVQPELPFKLLRDGVVTDEPAIEGRRAHFDEDVFPVLETAGVERRNLILAFDFVVGSEERLSGAIRSMRDQAYAWLDTVEANPEQVPFTITDVDENDCDQPGTIVWRTITGTYQVPLFLTGDIDDDTTPVTNVDENGVPVQNGFHDARLVATLPCSARDGLQASQAVLMGHGLFQNAPYFPTVIPPIVNQVLPWTSIAIATDWRGLSSLDFAWLGNHIIGIGESRLHNFPAFPARLRQGMVNTLVLARLMKSGILNRDPAFQRAGGEGVLPGPSDPLYYFGVSLGGIMGTYLAGLTPDVDNFVLDVGAVNFSCMLPRATPFKPFFVLLNTIGLTDSMHVWLGVQLTHELWASAEPVSVVHHVTSDPYPGSGNAKHVLYTAVWLDHQVSNTCTEIAARTMGLPVLAGSYQQSLVGLPDVAGPVDSALVFHHVGQLDILNPAHAPYIPPLTNDTANDPCDPHGTPKASVPTSIRQNIDFLQAGQASNFCTGLCDGDVPDELPLLPATCPVAP
jgi:hypothetical protein